MCTRMNPTEENEEGEFESFRLFPSAGAAGKGIYLLAIAILWIVMHARWYTAVIVTDTRGGAAAGFSRLAALNYQPRVALAPPNSFFLSS